MIDTVGEAKPGYAERLEDRRHGAEMYGFKIHAAVFAAVMTLLLVINLLDREVWWVQWALLGWGLGLLGHWYAVWHYRGRRVTSSERSRLQ